MTATESHVMVGRRNIYGFGTAIPEGTTAHEAMGIAKMANWKVRTDPLYVHVIGPDGVTPFRVPGGQGIVRDDPFNPGSVNVLGTAGKNYKASQNEALADLMQDVLDNSSAQCETAISINGGRRVMLQLRLDDMLIGGERIGGYLVGSNAHTGSESMKLFTTSRRFACENMFSPALKGAKSVYRIRHTGKSDQRIAEIRATLDLSFAYFEKLGEAIERMANTGFTDTQFRILMQREFGAPKGATQAVKDNAAKRQAEFTGLWNNSPTIGEVRNTRWAAYNVFTEWADHFSKVNAKGGNVPLVRAEKALNGGFDVLKQSMWNRLAV